MRLPTTLLACATLIASLSGCGATRTQQYTYFKENTTEAAVNRDVEELKTVRGVEQVIPRLDSNNKATLVIYVEEDDSYPGLEAAQSRGWQKVRF